MLALHLSFAANTVAGRSTGAMFDLSLRFVSGFYSGYATDTVRKKTLFPRSDVPAVDPATGRWSEPWYRVMQYIHDVKLGGTDAPTLPQIQSSVASVSDAAINASGSVAAITQFVETNAASQAAATEVLQAASVPGAAQIPPPVLTVPVTSTSRNEEAF